MAGDDPVTWAKYQPELFVRMAADGLSLEAAIAHVSAIGWLYQQERDSCRIPVRMVALGVTPLNEHPDAAAAELVRRGYWNRDEGGYELVEHADVIRESLQAQRGKKSRDRKAQQTARDKRSASALTSSLTQASKQPSNHASTETGDLGKCRTCAHREPLSPDGRCSSCVEWDVEEAS